MRGGKRFLRGGMRKVARVEPDAVALRPATPAAREEVAKIGLLAVPMLPAALRACWVGGRSKQQCLEKDAADLARMRAFVPEITPEQRKELEKYGIPFEVVPHYEFNTHSVSAAIRFYAGVRAMCYVAQQFQPDYLTIMYASRREIGLAPRSYAARQALEAYRPMLTAGDVTRNTHESVLCDGFYRQCLFFQDDFKAGTETLLQCIQRHMLDQTEYAIIVSHCFDGLFGDQYGEGAWYRGVDGLIHARPDSMLPEWPAHPALDEFHRNGATNDCVWTIHKAVGRELITAITRNKTSLAVSLDSTPLGCVSRKVVKGVWISWLPWIPRFLLERLVEKIGITELFDVRYLAALAEYLQHRRATSWTYLNVRQEATKWMHERAPRFSVIYPDLAQEQIGRHVAQAWLESVSSKVAEMVPMVVRSAEATGKLQQAYVAMDKPRVTQYKEFLKWGAVAAVCTGVGVLALTPGVRVMAQELTNCVATRATHVLAQATEQIITFCLGTVARVARTLVAQAVKAIVPFDYLVGWLKYLPAVVGYGRRVNYQGDGLSQLLLPNTGFYRNVVGPCLEEGLKMSGGALGVLVVAGAEFSADSFLVGAGKASLHIASMILPWYIRFPLHIMWNTGVWWWHWKTASRDSDWVRWKANVHDEYVPNRRFDYSNTQLTRFDPADAFVPRLCRPLVLEPKVQCRLSKLRYDDALLRDEALRGGDTCYFWPTNVPMYAASVNGVQLITAVRERICSEHPNLVGQTRNLGAMAAELATMLIPNVLGDVPRTQELEAAYLEHFVGRKRKEMEGYARVLHERRPCLGDKIFSSTQIKIKSDEHLVRPSGEFKARTIACVDPLVQVWVGPQLRLLTERLHAEWNLDSPPIIWTRGNRRWEFKPLYCPGWTDEQLGAFIRRGMDRPNSIHVAVVGDDSVVVVNDNGYVTYLWGDFSAFDQSQSYSALQLEYLVLTRLGAPRELIAVLRHMSTATYRYRNNAGAVLSVDRKDRPSRDTGGPDTTLGNSIVNVGYWALCSELLMKIGGKQYHVDDFVKRGLEHGFKIKVGFSTSIDDVSFLKGRFYRARNNTFVWGPLPSRFLKMGKSITDPRQLCNDPDLERACRKYARGVALTYSAYANIPLISAYVLRFENDINAMTDDERLNAPKRQLNYMVRGTNPEILDPVGDCAAFYHCDEQWFREANAMVREAPLFTFFEHPLFAVLAQDYN